MAANAVADVELPYLCAATAYTFFLSAEVNFSWCTSLPNVPAAIADAACAGDQYQAEIVGVLMYPTDLPTAVLWTRNNWWPQLAVQNDSPPYNVATPATASVISTPW